MVPEEQGIPVEEQGISASHILQMPVGPIHHRSNGKLSIGIYGVALGIQACDAFAIPAV